MSPPPRIQHSVIVLTAAFFSLGCDREVGPSGLAQLSTAHRRLTPSSRVESSTVARDFAQSHVRSRLHPAQEALLSELEAHASFVLGSNEDEGVLSVLSLREGDLLPEGCRAGSGGGGEFDARASALCFAEHYARLFGDHAGQATYRVARVLPGVHPDEQALILKEYVGDHPVSESHLALTFAQARLLAVSGRNVETGAVRRAAPGIDEARVLAGLAPDARRLDPERGFEYSVEHGRLVLRAYIESTEGVAYLLEAENGQILAEFDPRHYLPMPRTGDAYQWAANFVGQSISWAPTQVTTECTDQFPLSFCGSGSTSPCTFKPIHPVGLQSSKDRVTSVFTREVSQSNVVAVTHTGVCNAQPWASLIDHSTRWAAVSVKNTLDGIADYVNHADAMYGWGRDKQEVSLVVKQHQNSALPCTKNSHCLTNNCKQAGTGADCVAGMSCVCTQDGWTSYHPGTRELDIRHSVPPLQAQHAGVYGNFVAHEYTHYIQHMYKWNSDGHYGAVREGIADAAGVRYAAWKKLVGDWPSLTYESSLGLNFAHRYQQALRNGEYRLENYPAPFGDIDIHLYLDPSLGSNCFNSCISTNPACAYDCGQLLQHVYWALAFNQCRLTYLFCTNGLSLLTGVGYWQTRPVQVASDAFSYAMATASPSVTMNGFMDLVAARYAQYYAQGHITLTQLQRVESLLASHCAGPANVCPSGIKNPKSPLPRLFTAKKDYYEAEAGALYPPAESLYTVTRSADAYVRMNSGGLAFYAVNLAQSGMYRFNFLADVTSPLADEVSALAYDGRDWRNVGPMPLAGYTWYPRDGASEKFCAWSTRPTTIVLSTAPSHMFDFKLDVMVLERTGSLEGSCVFQCGAFQGCPSGMNCVSGVCQ